MLMMLAADIRNSAAADGLDDGAICISTMDWQLRAIMRELRPFEGILEEAGVPQLDDFYDLRRAIAAAEAWSDELMADDIGGLDDVTIKITEKGEAALRLVDLDDVPEGTPV